MENLKELKKKKIAIYGLGVTGKSVLSFLKKKRIRKLITWDDNHKILNKSKKKFFLLELSKMDYIVTSPGINIKKSNFKKHLLKNKHKIITDLDLFFLINRLKKTIIVTGTNGKSTTCALICHILKTNNFKTELVGNIGKPILSQKFNKNKIYIIEASSYQLEYSKFLKPNYALFLNISKDHIDWHGSMKNYINSKFKIFNNQSIKDHALFDNRKLIKIYKKKKYQGKFTYIKKNNFKNYLKEHQLKFQTEIQNINFAFEMSKKFKIRKKAFLKSLNSFKGLNHRYEIFLKIKKFTFINDSKATSFEATKKALAKSENIIWILGGQPKTNDKINIEKFKKKIIHGFIIGKHSKFFKKQLKNKISYTVIKELKDVMRIIFKFVNKSNKKITILFSPASASFDQFKNFEDRGNCFKKYTKYYAKRIS